jgi:Bacterial capsule synthesis protein PGA_cap
MTARWGVAVAGALALLGAGRADAAPRGLSLVWGGDVTLGSSYGQPPDRGWPQLAGVARVLRRADVAAVDLEGTFGAGGASKCGGSPGPNCFAFQAPPANARTLARAGVDVVNRRTTTRTTSGRRAGAGRARRCARPASRAPARPAS